MTADRPVTEPRTAQYFDPLAVMVGEFVRDFVEPTARIDAIDRLYSMLNEARAEAAQGAAPRTEGLERALYKTWTDSDEEVIAREGAAQRAKGPARCVICDTAERVHGITDHPFTTEGAAPRAEGITYEQGEAWLEANDLYPPDKPRTAPRRHKRVYREEGDDAPTLDEEPQ